MKHKWQLAILFLSGVSSVTVAAFLISSPLGFLSLGLAMLAVEWRFSEE